MSRVAMSRVVPTKQEIGLYIRAQTCVMQAQALWLYVDHPKDMAAMYEALQSANEYLRQLHIIWGNKKFSQIRYEAAFKK